MASFKSIALLALTTGFATIANAGASGSGSTTRYWDCCKGSCSWTGKADVSAPVTTCDKNDNPLTDYSATSGCDGGSAYMCSDQSPWAVNDTMAYGFAAVNIAGGSESSWCCSCYKLTFTSTSIKGKTMIVQATNTGGDLGSNQFDLAIPGGGVGIYNGCTDEWGAPSSGWGAQYGGISTDTCSSFPTALQSGCSFRFDWFEGADNPTVDFEQVACPAEITAKTGCVRNDDGSAALASAGTSAASSTAATSSAVAQSSSVASSSVASSSVAAVSSSSSAVVESNIAVASSSSSVAAVETSSSSAYVAPVETSSSSSYIAPSSSSSAAAPESTASDDANCQVQYVYEYDL